MKCICAYGCLQADDLPGDVLPVSHCQLNCGAESKPCKTQASSAEGLRSHPIQPGIDGKLQQLADEIYSTSTAQFQHLQKKCREEISCNCQHLMSECKELASRSLEEGIATLQSAAKNEIATAATAISKDRDDMASWAGQQYKNLEQQLQHMTNAIAVKQEEEVQALKSKFMTYLFKYRQVLQQEHSAAIKAYEAQLQQLKIFVAKTNTLVTAQEAAFNAERSEWQRQVTQLKADVAEIATLATKRQQDSRQLRYIVRGKKGTSGSVPCSLFGAEPNSLLNRAFNGDWGYAMDDEGRAIINSSGAHWPVILDWLSFGLVPANPTEAFIAECIYWQLDNLLQKMATQALLHAEPAAPFSLQAYPASSTVESEDHSLSLTSTSRDGCHGFQLEARVHNFCGRFTATNIAHPSTCTITTSFRACGRQWNFRISSSGTFLERTAGPTVADACFVICLGPAGDAWRCSDGIFKDDSPPPSWGRSWRGNELDKLKRSPVLDQHGSLQATVQLFFKRTC